MVEPSNSELMVEIKALKALMARLVRSLPVLAAVAGDADVKREKLERDRRRKEDVARIARGGK